MARKIQVRLIMQLRAAGLSQTEIARTHHMSKTSVSEVFSLAQERKITFADLEEKSNAECYRLFFPNKHPEETLYEPPDYGYVHKELSRTGVTLKLLWKEYRDRCKRQSLLAYGYSRFCDGYGEFVLSQNLTNRLSHKPSVASQVDWSGSTMQLVNPATGETQKVYLFVATLPYSQYTYVEGSVGVVSTWILAALRNRQFLSLMELNEAIHEKLETFNHKPFQKREGSRASCFEEEKLFLLPLPATTFELAVWKVATVQYNYHISVERMNYSVPYEYIKQKVDVRLTRTTVEVFFSGTRVASHLRLHGRPNQYSTLEEHMPPDHQTYLQWNGERFLRWAEQIGQHTATVVRLFLSAHKVEQQGNKSCMALLKLADRYSVNVNEFFYH